MMRHDRAPVGVLCHVPVRRADIRKIDADADRIGSLLNGTGRFQQALPNAHDGPIGRYEMLLATVKDRPHRHGNDGILLLDAPQATPVLLHALAVLAEPGGPSRLGITTLPAPVARVI